MFPTELAGNITRIVDPLGGVTTQTFDALGRLASRALPYGVASTWTDDARGWVDTIVHRGRAPSLAEAPGGHVTSRGFVPRSA